MGKLTTALISLGFLGVILAVIALLAINHEAGKQGLLETEKLVYIRPGSSIRMMSTILEEEKVISCKPCFYVYAKFKNYSKAMQAGEYQFAQHASIKEIVDLMMEGKTFQRSVTFPEGLTSSEIVDILNSNQYLSGDKITVVPPEGTLMPDTYYFSLSDKRSSIIERMKKEMSENLDKLWQANGANSTLKTKEEAVILASIIEKETAEKDERARVAGVFMNRINIGIPLQTDPTVIYAITHGKSKLDRPVTYKDLKTDSPYNTYMVKGLPPTAIANPGLESLKAAISPENNKYLYFVADGTGGHVFAKSLEEHNKNVAKWRKIEKQEKK